MKQNTITRNKAFTIVELLIVIVVIAVLATISVVSYNGIQDRTRATKLGDALNKTEKALNLWVLQEYDGNWPTEAQLNTQGGFSGGNPLINNLRTNTNFSLDKYLSEDTPLVEGFNTAHFAYDNDGDSARTTCANSASNVSILIPNMTAENVQKVDDAIDDGNSACGKVRRLDISSNSYLIYTLDS